MPFFSLTDIKIKEPTNTVVKGSLLPSPYQSNVLRYPLDIGSLDKGHYMVIHINEQSHHTARFQQNETLKDLPTILQNADNTNRRHRSQLNSTTASSSSAIGNLGKDSVEIFRDAKLIIDGILGSDLGKKILSGVSGSINLPEGVMKDLAEETRKQVETFFSSGLEEISRYADQLATGQGLRTIRRTTDTIALYMPDTLSFTHNQSYSSLEFGNTPIALLAAAAAGYSQITATKRDDRVNQLGKNLTPFFVSRFLQSVAGNAGSAIFAAGSGTVVNPQLELLYTSPSFREFRFDFVMYPRSSKEALEIHKILNRLKFHQAPQLYTVGAGALGNFFMIPPSEFDIKFYYNGMINPNIPPISTCVLTSIDTDYAPNGWAAYEVPSNNGVPVLGKTGMPLAIRLSLSFQETEILTKDYFNDSVGDGGLITTGYTSDKDSSALNRMSNEELR